MREINSDKGTSGAGDASAPAASIFCAVSAISFLRGFWVEVRGKVFARPDDPAANALVLGESLVCGFDDVRGIDWLGVGLIPQQQDSARLGVSSHGEWDDNAIFHCGLGFQRVLQVFGIDVHPGGSDDDVFLSALEKQIAFGIEFADVAGVVPALVAVARDRMQLAGGPVSGSHAGAANQDFAIGRELHFAAGDHFAD